MRDFQLVVVSGAPVADASVAIAASRAGAVGVLDLTGIGNEQAASDAAGRLARFGRGSLGVKIDASAAEGPSWDLGGLLDQLGTVILVPDAPAALPRLIGALHRRQISVLVESVSAEEAAMAEDAGADGVIAKGNEAGGRVGEQSTYILLQRLLGTCRLPVLAQGGIGPHIAAACRAAGAAGVVLDSQLLLTHESRLPAPVRDLITRMDGTETVCLGTELGHPFRLWSRPGTAALERLRRAAAELAHGPTPLPERVAAWREEVRGRVGWESPDHVWPVGQDASFARSLAERFGTVGRVLGAYRETVDGHVRLVQASPPFGEGSPLAESHGTRFPIVQGPMTRVSDQAAFAASVAGAGALPFLALALMRPAEVEALLEETRLRLGDRPWGVGILGFVPLGLREEQLEVILRYRPTFALIAGGRPDHAQALERAGIPTYLHVPSPTLLRLFVERGSRRFVFEGRECGGHVGPCTSFVLWEAMIDELLESLPDSQLADCHVLFAGGIHDARSAAVAATAAALRAARGAKIGVLLGSAYLFTNEAVTSGAIGGGCRRQRLPAAIRCSSKPARGT